MKRSFLFCSGLIAAFAVLPVALAQTTAPRKSPATSKDLKKSADVPSKGKEKEKVREGSYLRKELGPERKVDLRGGYEQTRDEEVMTHYQRLAALDWIEQLATKNDDTRLLERVEAVRRKEAKRHRNVMTELLEQSRGREMVGFQ